MATQSSTTGKAGAESSDSTPRAPEPVADLDWSTERARSLVENAAELWLELLERLPSLPVTQQRDTHQVREAVTLPIPEEPLTDGALIEHIRTIMFDHSVYPGHPAFLAYICGAGTVPGAVADFLASGLNQNLSGWVLSPAGTEIELYLTRWFARQVGFPETGGGVFVSGGAMANMAGLKLARDLRGGGDIRTTGLSQQPQLVLYASGEVHTVLYRAVDILGLGKSALRTIPTDERDRMRIDLLVRAIEEDLAAGFRPVAIVGTAGTVETGAIDPLEELANVARQYSLWFHVDGAYGGSAAVLCDELRPLFAGIERADSIAFDPHKWMYTPYSGSCLLVRNFDHLGDGFSFQANYHYQDLERVRRGLDYAMMGPQFSRSFQPLKVWLSLLAHGRKPYSRRIAHDAALAQYLGQRVEARPDFELVAPVSLSICCFRYIPPGLRVVDGREEYLDGLNRRLLTDLQMDGRVFCSNAVRHGTFALRMCIVNFRTEAKHLDQLLDVAAEIGGRLDAELRPPALRSA